MNTTHNRSGASLWRGKPLRAKHEHVKKFPHTHKKKGHLCDLTFPPHDLPSLLWQKLCDNQMVSCVIRRKYYITKWTDMYRCDINAANQTLMISLKYNRHTEWPCVCYAIMNQKYEPKGAYSSFTLIKYIIVTISNLKGAVKVCLRHVTMLMQSC